MVSITTSLPGPVGEQRAYAATATPPAPSVAKRPSRPARLTPNQFLEFLFREWEAEIQTQGHFNSLIITMRTTGLSVVVAVYGAAAFAIGNFRDFFIHLPIVSRQVHAGFLVVVFGVLLLVSLFIADFFYYFRLLIGSVRRTTQIDNMVNGWPPEDGPGIAPGLLGFTSWITAEVNRPPFREPRYPDPEPKHKLAGWLVFLFYVPIFLAGIAFAWVLLGLPPPPPTTPTP